MKESIHTIAKIVGLSTLLLASKVVANDNYNIDKMKKKALAEFSSKRYHNAQELLHKVMQHEPNEAWLHYSIGISYLHISSFEKALFHLKTAYELDPEKGIDKAYYYWLGKAYHQNALFDEAIEAYSLYETSLKPWDNERTEIELLKQQVENAKSMMDQPTGKVVYHFENGINSEFDDYSPIVTDFGNTLYFTSKRPIGDGSTQDVDGEFYESVFVIQRNELGVWSAPSLISRFKNEEYHESCVQAFDNGNKMLVYKGKGKGMVYLLQRDIFGNWMAIDYIKELEGYNHNGNLTISPDGNFIVFSHSDKSTGFDYDLFVMEKNNWGYWMKPKALSKLNSPWHELSPYFSHDGKKLYFSSNGELSMGGFDVLVSSVNMEKEEYAVPENLGYPVNSVNNEMFYQENESGSVAAFSSHREDGHGQMDIYVVYDAQMVSVHGSLLTNDVKNVEGMKIFFNSTTEKQYPFSEVASIESDGSFTQSLMSNNEYHVFLKKENEIIKKERFQIEKSDEPGKSINYYILLNNEKSPKKEALKLNDKLVIKHESGKTDFSKQDELALMLFVNSIKENPTTKVKVTGHTDDYGVSESNIELSRLRAQNVANYLINLGVDSSRIELNWKGENEPILNAKSSSENRRTEVEIIMP